MTSRRLPALLLTLLSLLLTACVTDDTTAGGTNPRIEAPSLSAQLRPGDTMTISLLGIPEPQTTSVQIDEQGFVRLQYIGAVTASGLTTAELSQSIRETYIAKQYFTTLDVSVNVTERYIYIGGEVQRPGRIPWSPDLTLAKAVQSAGGFSLYAKETKVTLTRDRKAYEFDVRLAQRQPEQDPLLFPGDSIQVPRSAF
ncbi:Polysaccharide biosynthesis/export protein [Lacunisphaera limnophila]|uniref:Polysaccharide biosynthesis/export protein n=1 Tax=Lacunisphaera limnophila TaxID=1838286 RepID=A0A1D8AXN3_9BACT|nr:polysaccharide biosynthesis/export family protein [Lacunisphaera limnophila]AOS45641.1 Polysaccharide biosynthesis/export protein [Lacunisphaera limnophila]